MTRIHFGLIGLKIGDTVKFVPTQQPFAVASGDGTPDNGGTLVVNVGILGRGLYSLRAATHTLLGDAFKPKADVFKLWDFAGKTLRAIYKEKHRRNGEEGPVSAF